MSHGNCCIDCTLHPVPEVMDCGYCLTDQTRTVVFHCSNSGGGLSGRSAGTTGGDDDGTGHAVEELTQVQLGCTNPSVPVYNTVVVKNFRYWDN